jgi:hypothetical protein
MGFGIRARPTTPLIPLPRLKALGVRRVTLPRMLPAAAIKGMTRALEVMKEVIATGVPRRRWRRSTGRGEVRCSRPLLSSHEGRYSAAKVAPLEKYSAGPHLHGPAAFGKRAHSQVFGSSWNVCQLQKVTVPLATG